MLESFSTFIEQGKALAAEKGLIWDFPLDEQGKTPEGWNMTEAVGALPPTLYVRDLGHDEGVLHLLNAQRVAAGSPTLPKSALSQSWQDLIKAAVCDQLFFRRNTPRHVFQNIIRPLKVLATCAGNLQPWQMSVDIIQEAVTLATRLQPSGKLADLVLGITKTLIDTNHLAVACPLYSAVSKGRSSGFNDRKSRVVKSQKQLLDDLEQRKKSERLPERRAFWELVRIIFTESPRSYSDALRFAALKVMVLCGLRIGEATMLPMDWKRYRDYYDPKGRPAGELGGYSRSLSLRHFAEKQQVAQSDSTVLVETAQPIPEIFAEILSETLDEVIRITTPVRETLRLQVQSGRWLPWYKPDDLVPVTELYGRLTGNPFWLNLPVEMSDQYVARYREHFSPDVLAELSQYQLDRYQDSSHPSELDMAMYVYFHRLCSKTGAPKLRHASGAEYHEKRKKWREVCLNIGELEDYLIKSVPTKLSDLKPIRLQQGELQTWELLFLFPKRTLAEERDEGITDLTRYASVGMPESKMLSLVLGEEKNRESLFSRYGASDEDRQLFLISHSLRHLQNTELFRLGVADTIITKRFNRRSVAQSYQYDHRSLAEELESVELPAEVEVMLGSKASTVARLIKSGKASGPIVDAFKQIQKTQGDADAFDFLKGESDGFHVTPYGYCINSFTVDPCPKNLECFSGCSHLTATDMPEHRKHLEVLEQRFEAAISVAESRRSGSLGRDNQITHATIRLEAIRKILSTSAGRQVFPDGPDLSVSNQMRSILDE